ncbi:hypothetical protein BC834DRAFT_816738 [Gloeopeniophorella convolvens]|nr:hypothetical protein BC834DRAFT_816738 [Gloeopeniophorella convolvens]
MVSALHTSRSWFTLLRAGRPCFRALVSTHRHNHLSTAKRHISSIIQSPQIHEFASSLAQTQPHFAISPEKIQVLSRPSSFYEQLIDLIRNAQTRIFISSLYIGSSETELVDALRDALHAKPSLHVYLQLDYNRSTRPGRSSTTALLAPLVRDFPDRCHVSLFRSPKLKGVLSKLVPPRFNEGFGTWHAKVYGADDNIMISGANLNKSYFTDRQDRYLLFSMTPELSNYCFDFLMTAASFSYKLLPASSPGDNDAHTTLYWPHMNTHPSRIEPEAKLALSKLQQHHVAKSVRVQERLQSEDSVTVFPIIQAGQFGIREEEESLKLLFRHMEPINPREMVSASQPLLNLTSGYFGLFALYKDLILRSPIHTRILCASPKANGFYGSKGISHRLPEGYTWLEQRFMAAVRASQSGDPARSRPSSGSGSVELKEWSKDSWTYHAKGIWLSPNPESLPVLTLFGSTNLNSRSAHLDTELSFMMLANSIDVRKKLQHEVQGLNEFAEPWRGDQRPVRLVTKLLARILSGFL